MQINYKGHSIKVESVNDSLRDERDVAVSGALIPALELEGGAIDTQVDENGVTWFNAKDVCGGLGFNTSNVARILSIEVKEKDRSVRATLTKGGKQNVNYINESGLYSLILGSKLPKAKEFKHWITSEVLPAIRKTGSYTANKDSESKFVVRTRGDFLAIAHKNLSKANKEVRTTQGKPVEGDRMERSEINIAKMVHTIAFGQHLEGGIRQVLDDAESRLLITVMGMFSAQLELHPEKSLKEIKEKIISFGVKQIPLTQEQIDARLRVKELSSGTETKKLK